MDASTRALPGVVDLRDLDPPFRWEQLFAAPVDAVEIEIGSGKGMFLRRASAENPRIGYLGVERAGKWFAVGAARLAKEPRPNLRVVQADAFDLLVRWVVAGSVQAVHVYFPDPWPKKRHAKRRLLAPALFDLSARALRPGGWFQMATDVAPYFVEASDTLRAHPSFAEASVPDAEQRRVATHYAVKYEREGRSLHLARFVRNATSPPPVPPPPSRPRKSASTAPAPDRADAP